MQTLSKEEIEQLRKKVEPIKKLAFHDDADGVSSAVLLSYIFKINKIWAPEDFGEWPIKPYKVEGQEQLEIPPDACVDMVPANPQWIGLCFDHHPGHPPEGQRGYQLIHGDGPTAVVVYTLFRGVIPKDQRWKIVVGAVGDGQPELIPPEVWREFPVLLEETVTSWERYGKIETSNYPLYLRLSSGINAMCKLPEKWYNAYMALRNAKSPWDLINDTTLKSAKDIIDGERSKVYRETSPIQLRNGIRIWGFESPSKIERTVAWEMWDKDKRTIVAINRTTARGSIRGTLATLVYEHLSQYGFKASGHPGFGGLKLKPNQTFEEVYQCLANLKI